MFKNILKKYLQLVEYCLLIASRKSRGFILAIYHYKKNDLVLYTLL